MLRLQVGLRVGNSSPGPGQCHSLAAGSTAGGGPGATLTDQKARVEAHWHFQLFKLPVLSCRCACAIGRHWQWRRR